MPRKAGKQVDTTSDNADPKKVDERVRFWCNEIDAAKEREKDFRKDGERIIEIYDGTKAETTPFNILYSNTETLVPALYSAIPRPVVQRRFKDEDPLGKNAAQAGQRMLEFLLDTNIEGYETYNDAMKAATLDATLPGRGVTNVKYDFEEGQLAPETKSTADTAAEDVDPATPKEPPAPIPYKKSELVCTEAREWNRVYFGFARKWSAVPWVAYEEYIDKDEAERLFGEKAATLKFTTDEDADEEEGKPRKSGDDKNQGERKTCLIYKIWDKRGGRKVRFIAPQDKTQFMRVDDDPLGLTGFFDCPQPIQFIDRPSNLVPVALYILYENQARELNRLTLRINKVVEALKARGAYDSALGSTLERIMTEDDNALVPTDQEGTLSAEKGLDKSIWFMPLAELVNVLDKLYIARESCKQVIYEIIGIADIMRGASKASETLGAQEIKNQWGTLRIKPKQAEVQRYARDLLRMMLEVAATKFSEETWAKMTGLPFLLEPQFLELSAVAKALQQEVAVQQQMAAAQPPPQAAPGEPPAQPQQSPQQMQLQQVTQQLQTPKWSDVLAMLRDDMQRAFRIDIETNSTVEPEAVEDQKNIAELMATLGQFLQGLGPLVQSGVMPFEVAQSMMLAISRRYRFGSEIEDQIKAMKPPAPQDNGEAQKAQQQLQDAEQARRDAEMKLQVSEAEKKLMAQEIKLSEKERDLEVREHKLAIETSAREESLKMRDQAGQDRIATKEKISHISEAAAKREKQNADGARKNVDAGAQALAKTSDNLQQMMESMLKIIAQQGEQTQAMVQSLMAAITAPRKRIAERDETGRLASVREEVELPQTGTR